MNTSKDLCISLVVNAIIITVTVTYLILSDIQAYAKIKITLHSWAWLILAISIVTLHEVRISLPGFLGVALKSNALEPPTGDAIILRNIAAWVTNALALFVTAALAPGLATYNSAIPVVVVAIVIGIVSGTSELFRARRKSEAPLFAP